MRPPEGFPRVHCDGCHFRTLLLDEVAGLVRFWPRRRAERQDDRDGLSYRLDRLQGLLHGPNVEDLGLRRDQHEVRMAGGVVGDIAMDWRAVENDEISASRSHSVEIVGQPRYLDVTDGEGRARLPEFGFPSIAPKASAGLRIEIEKGNRFASCSAATAKAVASVVFPTPPF